MGAKPELGLIKKQYDTKAIAVGRSGYTCGVQKARVIYAIRGGVLYENLLPQLCVL